MTKHILTKSLSIFTSLALVFCSLPSAAFVAPSISTIPDFVRTLTPPTQLGYIDTYYQGRTEKPVILIQDLHANYGVQQKIMGILKHLQSHIAAGGKPMVVGIEAAWGDVDTSYLSKEAKDVRLAAGEFLMKEAEISGMDNFAANSDQPVHLVGIDNEQDYLLHRELIRKSLSTRLALAQKIQQVREAIAGGKTGAPEGIQQLWKTEASFEKGEIGLPELAQTLNVPTISNYGEAERLLYQKKAELAQKEPGESGFFLNNLVKVDQDLALLSRLFRQQLTLEEVQFASRQVPEMLSAIQALLPGENMQEWQEAIRSAIDYYALALMRDKPLGENTRALAEQYSNTSIVAVTGGFHTAGIASLLKEKNISYVVIAPNVESHTSKDEILYFQRMLGNEVSEAEITAAAHIFHRTQDTAAILDYSMRVLRGETNVAPRTIAAFRNVAPLPRTISNHVRQRNTWPLPTGRFGNPGAALDMQTYLGPETPNNSFEVLKLLAQGRLFYNVRLSHLKKLKETLLNDKSTGRMDLQLDIKKLSPNKLYVLGRQSDLPENRNLLIPELSEQNFDFRVMDILISDSGLLVEDPGNSLIPLLIHEKKRVLNSFQAAMSAYGLTLDDLFEKIGGRIRIELRPHDVTAEADLLSPIPTIILDSRIMNQGDDVMLGIMLRELGHFVGEGNDRKNLTNALIKWMQVSTAMGFRSALAALGVSRDYFDNMASGALFRNAVKDEHFVDGARESLAKKLATYLLMNRPDTFMPDGQVRMTLPFTTHKFGNPGAAINLTEFLAQRYSVGNVGMYRSALFQALDYLDKGYLFYGVRSRDLTQLREALTSFNISANKNTRSTMLTLQLNDGIDSENQILGKTSTSSNERNVLVARTTKNEFRKSLLFFPSFGQVVAFKTSQAPDLLDSEKEKIQLGFEEALEAYGISLKQWTSLLSRPIGVEIREHHDFLAEYDPRTSTFIFDQSIFEKGKDIMSLAILREVGHIVDPTDDRTRLATALDTWLQKMSLQKTPAYAVRAALTTLGASDQVLKIVNYILEAGLKEGIGRLNETYRFHLLYRVAGSILQDRGPALMPEGAERLTLPFKAEDPKPTPELEVLAAKPIVSEKPDGPYEHAVTPSQSSGFLSGLLAKLSPVKRADQTGRLANARKRVTDALNSAA